MSDRYTKLARGMPCQVRLPMICNGNIETTVAAHYRSISLGAGIGIKPQSWLTAHSCSSCHDAIDGRVKTNFTRDELRLMHAEGIFRTLLALQQRGEIDL